MTVAMASIRQIIFFANDVHAALAPNLCRLDGCLCSPTWSFSTDSAAHTAPTVTVSADLLTATANAADSNLSWVCSQFWPWQTAAASKCLLQEYTFLCQMALVSSYNAL